MTRIFIDRTKAVRAMEMRLVDFFMTFWYNFP